jgi:AcrR family transcriptional regulator
VKKSRSDAAARILREALRLFSEQGYERTSVPDIQAAAGLARGSGAMYKHYHSKEAVLNAGIDRYISVARSSRAAIGDPELSPEAALEALARGMLDSLAGKRDELRILWRDVEQFPELQAGARREIMQATYATVASWLDRIAQQGLVPEHDSEAVAAVLVGSIAMFRVFPALWGERTIDIDDERFLRAWTRIALQTLGLDPPISELS